MLVKILSYAASVVGSARHRAVLASCFVLVIAFAGILSIPLMHNAPVIKLAGSAQDETDTDTQSEPVWLSDRQLQPKPQEETDSETTPKPANSNTEQTASTEASTGESDQSENSTELSLSKTELILEPGSISSDIYARVDKTSDDITWSIVPDKNLTAGDLAIVDGEQQEFSVVFRVRAGANVKVGIYQVAVTAKSIDSTVTKTLTVTIQ